MTTTETAPTEYIDACPVGRIRVDPINPRSNPTVDDDFVASIAAGILEPLIVRVDPANPQMLEDAGACDFLIVAGERRYTAALKAELAAVPVIVRHDITTDAQALVVMVVENGQRESLPPLDEARAIETLVGQGMSQREVAKAIGREQGTVSKRLSLRKLPTRAQQLLEEERITVKTALGLTGLIKHNGELSDVLDYATRRADTTDADIAALTFRKLDAIAGAKSRAKAEKAAKERAAALVERGLVDLDELAPDDQPWDEIEECEEADAEAFQTFINSDEVDWFRHVTESADKEHEPDTDDPETYADAVAKAEEQKRRHDELYPPRENDVIADAARDYVAARHALHDDPDEIGNSIAVDGAWEHLRLACGYSHADFDETVVPSTVVAEPTPDIATVDTPKPGDPCPYCLDGRVVFDQEADWRAATPDEIAGPITTSACPDCEGTGTLIDHDAPQVTDPSVDDTTDDAPHVPELDEPWKGYESFGATRNIKVIHGNGPFVTPDALHALIEYETARQPSRQSIIDAAHQRLDTLESVNA